MKKVSLLIIIYFIFSSAYANYESGCESTRALGMGNAFIGLSNSPDGIFYNPAGICQINNIQISSSYSRLFINLSDGSNIGSGNFALVYPFEFGVLGFAYNNFHLISYYFEHSVITSYARKINNELFAGINLKFLASSVGEDDYTRLDPLFASGYTTYNFTFDVGILWKILKNMNIGVVVTNVTNPNMALSKDDKDNVPISLKGGIAYRYKGTDILLDAIYITNQNKDFSIRFGAEKWLAKQYGIRIGTNIGSRKDYDISCGIGYRTMNFSIDYSFIYPISGISGTYGTHRVGLLVKFGKEEIEKEEEYGYEEVMPKAEHERRTAALRKELEDSTTQIERLKLELEEKGKKLQELSTQEKETKEKEINELKVQIEKLNKELEEAKRRAEEAERKLKERKPTKTETPTKLQIPGLSPDGKTYTVQKGDTSLKSIAKKIYGDESKWQEIYNLNADRIKQGKINPGDILILPEK